MSENKQIYLKEDEVEHVISALSGNTSARDLAEAIGRSEDEVIAVIQEMRQGQQPPSEIDLLREQNALLAKQIEELKATRPASGDRRRQIRIAAAVGAVMLLILGAWTMFFSMNARSPVAVPIEAHATTSPAPPPFAETAEATGTPVSDSVVVDAPPQGITPIDPASER